MVAGGWLLHLDPMTVNVNRPQPIAAHVLFGKLSKLF